MESENPLPFLLMTEGCSSLLESDWRTLELPLRENNGPDYWWHQRTFTERRVPHISSLTRLAPVYSAVLYSTVRRTESRGPTRVSVYWEPPGPRVGIVLTSLGELPASHRVPLSTRGLQTVTAGTSPNSKTTILSSQINMFHHLNPFYFEWGWGFVSSQASTLSACDKKSLLKPKLSWNWRECIQLVVT